MRPSKTKAEKPCVRATMSSAMDSKDRAQQYSVTARSRVIVQSARVFERRIKAGGIFRDFWVVVVYERTGDPHEWKSRGTSTTSKNVEDEKGPLVRGVDIYESERCDVCGATRSRFLRWEPR